MTARRWPPRPAPAGHRLRGSEEGRQGARVSAGPHLAAGGGGHGTTGILTISRTHQKNSKQSPRGRVTGALSEPASSSGSWDCNRPGPVGPQEGGVRSRTPDPQHCLWNRDGDYFGRDGHCGECPSSITGPVLGGGGGMKAEKQVG